ncbi:hypothetical protein DF185_15930 [Marinifilum breve]|uniref:Curli assembly protein CsgC n=1 Tax=Marinifilum breve TaxID=2184082 RepID=A0A2V3ZU28_9BACT|nr:curli-like amyloid fiber formation chaperone CsgH [Marinifilum breve]PXX98863.1 hypothetical protein DF185_15930 [Marinifilum breve]
MILRTFMFGVLLFLIISTSAAQPEKNKMKAWIEIEGEIKNLTLSAKFKNEDGKTIAINYVLKTKKEGRSGNSTSTQKGKCISSKNKQLTLSKVRLNLSKKDNLFVSLIVYHNKQLVAQDSVVLHGDNE